MDVIKKVGGALFALIFSAIAALSADLLGSFIGGIVLEFIDFDNLGNSGSWIIGTVLFVIRALLFSGAAALVWLLIGKIYKNNVRLANIAAGIGGVCVPIVCIFYGEDVSTSLVIFYASYLMFFIRVNSNEKQPQNNSDERTKDVVYYKSSVPTPEQQIQTNKPVTYSKKTILTETQNAFECSSSTKDDIFIKQENGNNVTIADENIFTDKVSILAEGKKSKDKSKLVLITLLVISIIFSGGLFVYYQGEVNDLLETQSSLEKEINSLKKENKSLDKKADDYDKIVKLLKKGNVGYVTSSFKTNKGIIYLSPGDQGKITLTTSWNGSGTVYHNVSASNVATIDFNEDSWYDYTTLTITAHKEGICEVVFSNSRDSNEFRVIVVVKNR